MLYTYDETTGGAKRIDWDLNCLDWTKEEDQELLSLVKKFLAKRPFANDYQDLDIDLRVSIIGKWHDEYPDYGDLGEEFDTSQLEEENVLKELLDLVFSESDYYEMPRFRGKYEKTLKRIQLKLKGV
mgnify:FL=1|tara:strand:+ start:122 stop:502 length:381 start_codon:yes stop_codon:yes gene_type:complete